MTAASHMDLPVLLDPAGIDALIAALAARGFSVIGPTLRDETIVYDRIDSLAALPAGWTDRQEAGHYRLERRTDAALFGYAVGPQSWTGSDRQLTLPVIAC